MSVEHNIEHEGTLYPASAAQLRLWFLYQLDSSDTSYNMSQAFRLRGKLNREALRDSLNHIVARHSVLRTVFTVHDHFPMQWVRNTLRIDPHRGGGAEFLGQTLEIAFSDLHHASIACLSRQALTGLVSDL